MLVAAARRFGALALLVLIEDVLGAGSRSVANLAFGVALFGVRQERGALAGRACVAGCVAVGLVLPPRA
jgi:hypothetical protein